MRWRLIHVLTLWMMSVISSVWLLAYLKTQLSYAYVYVDDMDWHTMVAEVEIDTQYETVRAGIILTHICIGVLIGLWGIHLMNMEDSK